MSDRTFDNQELADALCACLTMLAVGALDEFREADDRKAAFLLLDSLYRVIFFIVGPTEASRFLASTLGLDEEKVVAAVAGSPRVSVREVVGSVVASCGDTFDPEMN